MPQVRAQGHSPSLSVLFPEASKAKIDVVSYAQLKPMLKTLQQIYESRGVVAPLVAILVMSAILLVVVLPIFDAGFDHLTFSLRGCVFSACTHRGDI